MKTSKTGLVGLGLLAVAVAAAAASAPSAHPVVVRPVDTTSCDSLADLSLPDTTITAAERIPAGSFTPVGGQAEATHAAFKMLPAFCRVAGVIKPSPDSNTRFEVWLPLEGWNQRFQGVGNGGFAGTISYSAMAAALQNGYATASTDTGHEAEAGMSTATWALLSPDRIKDFGDRAVHEMTVKSKAVVAQYYGSQPLYSYWIGCSEGGRQGMGEAQKYPTDYDGIVAGAPVFGFTHTQTRTLALQRILREDPSAFIPGSKLRMLNKAVLSRCDGLDGVQDGVIENPPACPFDPADIQCVGGDAADCLTPSQVRLMRAQYSGPRNPRTGELIAPGNSVGFELELGERNDFRETPPAQPPLPSAFWRYFVFDDPNWDGTTFDFDQDLAFADRKLGAVMNNFDPDLRPFAARGGKLIHYHGWSDPQPSPMNSIAYFNDVQATVGEDTGNFYRLFMIPGMGHCSGGTGTDQFDKMAAIRAWVEEGKAPETLIAERRVDGQVVRTRPLCPYPQVATYKGTGDTDDARSFECAAPQDSDR